VNRTTAPGAPGRNSSKLKIGCTSGAKLTTRHDNAGRAGQSASSRSAAHGSGTSRAGRESAKASESVEKRFFGYKFKNPGLLTLALTHSSLAYENSPERTHEPGSDNEQLEFIGDAVLGLVVAEALYRRFPALREGTLTRLRASLVSSRNLAQVAARLELGPLLRLGRGEEHSGGQKKPALLANALEAVIAAIYLDGGLTPAREFIHRQIIEPAEAEMINVLQSSEPFSGAVGDYKSALQERLQAAGAGQPKYLLTDQSGPDHRKNFRIEVRVSDAVGAAIKLAEAEGTTKKQAQQEAARRALTSLLSGALRDILPNGGTSSARLIPPSPVGEAPNEVLP
jgi:ribonuclease III